MEIKTFNTSQINFQSMKASQFKSLEYSAMRKFKVTIEKFNTMNDFYTWAGKKYIDLISKDLGGRDASIQLKRKVMKDDWISYFKTLGNITMPVTLLIMTSFLKDLKDNNSDLLPQLNSDIFLETIESIKTKLKNKL